MSCPPIRSTRRTLPVKAGWIRRRRWCLRLGQGSGKYTCTRRRHCAGRHVANTRCASACRMRTFCSPARRTRSAAYLQYAPAYSIPRKFSSGLAAARVSRKVPLPVPISTSTGPLLPKMAGKSSGPPTADASSNRPAVSHLAGPLRPVWLPGLDRIWAGYAVITTLTRTHQRERYCKVRPQKDRTRRLTIGGWREIIHVCRDPRPRRTGGFMFGQLAVGVAETSRCIWNSLT